MKAIKELKLRLPSERKAKGHSSTLNALKYALQCVRQVRGEPLDFISTRLFKPPSLFSKNVYRCFDFIDLPCQCIVVFSLRPHHDQID